MTQPRTGHGALRVVTRLIAFLAATSLFALALSKLTLFDGFVQTVASHGLVSEGHAPILAGVGVGAELLLSVTALWMLLTRGSAAASLGVLTVFMIPILFYTGALALSPPASPASCGCGFSSAPVQDWASVLTRNAWLGITLGGAWLGALGAGPPPVPGGETGSVCPDR